MVRALILLIVLGVVGLGVFELGNRAWTGPGPSNRDLTILIAAHTSVHAVARDLQTLGAVRNALVFEGELHLRGGAVKAGEYALPAHASMADIAGILASGKSIQHKLTAAEGLTSGMIYKLVVDDPVLVGDAGPEPAEGTLLPETYLFTRGTSRAEIIARMQKAQQKFLSEAWAGRVDGLPLASPPQAMVLASIVEKETALPEERRHIAAVFVNRLKAGMKLQSDPTIIYGITKGYPLGRGIRESEIQAQTPYNTYAITGLPPTPICNPGKDAISAVLRPDDSSDLYFVANGQGGHVFSTTMAEHLRNVAAWRQVEKSRFDLAQPMPAAPDIVRQPAPHKALLKRRHAR